ncbi:hemagglutinin repeat-containing protein, partial [Ramlibacter sp. AN1015]|uniref:hemagglutinin repeat-containing protein n=1 Tax=Ramlibacter sp. AN1015 TaxID=3133428 RepID=UPI0030BEDED5
RLAQTQQSLSGGTLSAGGDLTIQAREDITALGARITSDQGHTSLVAGRDVKVGTLTTEHTSERESLARSRGFLSSSSTEHEQRSTERLAEGTLVAGERVTIRAGRDALVSGSEIVAQQDVVIDAVRDARIEAAQDEHTSSSRTDTKKSGLGALGGVSYGSSREQLTVNERSTTARASTVGSVQGNVRVRAGNDVHVIGSDVLALEGDVDISGLRVYLPEARERTSGEQRYERSQGGLSVSITGAAISAVQGAQQTARSARNTDDSRSLAMAAGSLGLTGYSAANALANGQAAGASAAQQAGGINLSISLGSARSASTTRHASDSARGTQVIAGGDLRVTARGAGADSNIIAQGATLRAGGTAVLDAENDVLLLAARNTAEQHSTNRSSSASVGVSYGTDGLLFNASASAARGRADGNDVTWTNTQVAGG